MSNNLRVNVLNGFNYQMPQIQVSSAYIKRAMEKNVNNGLTYSFSPIPLIKQHNSAASRK